MHDTRAFYPLYIQSQPNQQGTLAASVTVAATASSGASAIFSGVNGLGNNYNCIQVANQTSAWAYVNFGVFGNVAAATVAGSYPVAPGAVVVVSVHPEVTGATVILAAGGSGSVAFTRGDGV